MAAVEAKLRLAATYSGVQVLSQRRWSRGEMPDFMVAMKLVIMVYKVRYDG